VYFNLGASQIEAYDVTAGTASSTIYELGIDQPLAEVRPDGAVLFYQQDRLGNVVMLTNNSGSTVQTYCYNAWGKVSGFDAAGAPIATTAILSRFLFTGREFDQETGLYHYRARAYSGELGRFMQFDPIDFAGQDANILRYVSNNPMNLIDPYGTFSWPSVVGVAAGIASVALFPTYPAIAIGVGVVGAGFLIYDLYDTYNTQETLEDVVEDITKDHLDTIRDLTDQPSDPTIPTGGECNFAVK
jgi:RHS repeat-associated protein